MVMSLTNTFNSGENNLVLPEIIPLTEYNFI